MSITNSNTNLLKFLIKNASAVIETDEDKELAMDLLEEIDEVVKMAEQNNEKISESMKTKISALKMLYSLM
jgi:hypothetical protein